MQQLINKYRKAEIYKLTPNFNWGDQTIRYKIRAKEGELTYYEVEHELDERNITEEKAIKIAKTLIDNHWRSKDPDTPISEIFCFNSKYKREPTFMEIAIAEGEAELFVDNE